MSHPDPPRILVVDDEEAILETISFTFMDVYEVITCGDPTKALALADEHAPISVIITDQRMPGMTGVELLKQIYKRHPDTVRVMLTGFADSEATVQAINDGHIYAYINKPWEPEELKQVVRRAVEHHQLSVENHRLLYDLVSANSIMEAVMDRLDVGAVAVDGDGVVRAANAPARAYLESDALQRGIVLEGVLRDHGLNELADKVERVCEDGDCPFEDIDLRSAGGRHNLRMSAQQLAGPEGEMLGRVLLFKEISHEPLRRGFEQIVGTLCGEDGGTRSELEVALDHLAELQDQVKASEVSSASMAELGERVSRTRTAVQNWLDVDDTLAREDYPDAQTLQDRMQVASQRWPRSGELPVRVQSLAERVADYYESGENPRERVL